MSKLASKRSSIATELTRVVAAQTSRALADCIYGNVHTTAVMSAGASDYGPFTLTDYMTGGQLEVTLPRDNAMVVTGGVNGLKAYAGYLHTVGKKGRRGEAKLVIILDEITAAEGVIRQLVTEVEGEAEAGAGADDGAGDSETVVKVKRRAIKATKGLVQMNWAPAAMQQQQPGLVRGPAPPSAVENFREFCHPPEGGVAATHTILVGGNRRQNERLSLRVAKAGDVWLHARGSPGAHVVVKSVRGVPPYDERAGGDNTLWHGALQLAANLAAFYSEMRTESKADVTLALPKHVIKPPNAPLGAVKLREELGSYLGNAFNVPEECKRQREEGARGK